MPRTTGAQGKHHTRIMPRTPAVTQLKHIILQNPGLKHSELAKRLDTDYNNLQSLLVRAEAQGVLLTQSPQRPSRIYLFRDLTETHTI